MPTSGGNVVVFLCIAKRSVDELFMHYFTTCRLLLGFRPQTLTAAPFLDPTGGLPHTPNLPNPGKNPADAHEFNSFVTVVAARLSDICIRLRCVNLAICCCQFCNVLVPPLPTINSEDIAFSGRPVVRPFRTCFA